MSNKNWGKRKKDGQAYPKRAIPVSGGNYDIISPPTMCEEDEEDHLNPQVVETFSRIIDWREQVRSDNTYGIPSRADMEDFEYLIQELPRLNQTDFNAIRSWKNRVDQRPRGIPSRVDMEDLDDILDNYR